MIIIPAILPKNQTDLTTKVKKLLGVISHVQVDVCDGVFVKSKTKFHELPYPLEMEYELDLMIDQPEQVIVDYIDMQPARIIIHLEGVKDFVKLFLALEQVRGIIEIGLCVSNTTDVAMIEKHIEDADFIQVMGISKIGYQGEPFDEEALKRTAYFHEKYPDMPIAVDGAVNSETVPQLIKAGATRLVVGSAVFGEGNPGDTCEKLDALI